MKKILLMGGLGLLLVALSAGGTYFFVASKAPKITTTKVVHDSNFLLGPTFTMPDRVVNLADPGANRYLKVQIVLAFSPQLDSQGDVNKKVNDRMTVLQDILTTVLSSETTAQLSTKAGKDALKKAIITQFSQVLDDLHLSDLYFPEFVMQ
jgi:flagellar basal body-associated protein FliL